MERWRPWPGCPKSYQLSTLALSLAAVPRFGLHRGATVKFLAAAGRFRSITIVSHDLRTPLSELVGVMQLLVRSPQGPQERRLIDLGQRAGRTPADLVAEIPSSA